MEVNGDDSVNGIMVDGLFFFFGSLGVAGATAAHGLK